ncbi:hypothetical protein BBJ28_00011893 [Nothophytophthora sp. Chile5]|nr:hypothetical protein BBJ28_00011893 [Nothophytophthora sp. Chile5]
MPLPRVEAHRHELMLSLIPTPHEADDFISNYMFGPDDSDDDQMPLEQICDDEFKRYLADITTEKKLKNTFQWWNQNQLKYPNLSKPARKWLVTVATSVPSERAFSSSGNVVTVKRSSLTPETVQFVQRYRRRFKRTIRYDRHAIPEEVSSYRQQRAGVPRRPAGDTLPMPRRCVYMRSGYTAVAGLRVLLAALGVVLAVVSGGTEAQSSSSSSSSATVTTTAETLAQEWFTSNFDDNETQLAVGVNSALNNLTSSQIMCNGVPGLQRLTVETAPNGGCPDVFTAVNASCSCLTSGYTDTDTWEFHVSLRGSDSAYPTTLTSTDVLPIDSIRTLLVPSNLTTLCVYIQLLVYVFCGRFGSVYDGSLSCFNADRYCVAPRFSPRFTVDTNTSSGSNYLLIGLVAGGCALVLVLLAIVFWMRFSRHKSHRSSSSKGFYSQEFGDTLDFDDTQVQVDPAFLNDPVIITNRIDHKDLKLGRCISKGGFGLVFMGEYKGRRVAIKKIRPDRSGEVAEIELFLKEIILMAVLYHPRIVEFIGVAWDNLQHLSAVTEFMDNGDLRDVLHGFKEKGERLSWESHKATIALHIAEALSYLHLLKPKVIHRDLKSKNVLLNMYLEAKLSDFGISRMRYVVETHMTAGVGTSFWIAPEVLLGRDYDEAADIYSFGVVLSEIDTDDYPYWNDEHTSNRGKIQEAEILSLVAAGKLRPSFTDDCPKAILDLADCCLQTDPQDRPSAAEIVVILQHHVRNSSKKLREAASVVTARKPRRNSRRMVLQRVVGALLAAACVFVCCFTTLGAAARSLRVERLSSDVPLETQMQVLCSGFGAICDYVVAHCDVEDRDDADALDAKCVAGFQLFYQHSNTLSRCEEQTRADSHEKKQTLAFLQRYNEWQKRHACALFHTTEAKAARECSGVNAHRPWKQETWPLFCHETFTMYNSTRHELDTICERTANSEAFWEGYVDYIASPTCKRYYDRVREARERHCGETETALHSAECREMFQWYVAHQKVVEVDCFELRASKPFYRGFYAWKKLQQPRGAPALSTYSPNWRSLRCPQAAYSTRAGADDTREASLEVVVTEQLEATRLETRETENHSTSARIAVESAMLGHRDVFEASEETLRCPVRLRLTASQPRQVSSVWYAQRLPVLRGFETRFTFQITDQTRRCFEVKDQNFGLREYQSCAVHGGDGLAFVLHSHPNLTATLGAQGSQMGFVGLQNSLAIEFDTWFNDDSTGNDVFYDHVAIYSRGQDANAATESARISAAAVHSLADGKVHAVKIRYYTELKYEYVPYFSATTNLVKFIKDVSEGRRVGTLVVFMDEGIASDTPLLAIPINLAAALRLDSDEAFVVRSERPVDRSSWQKQDVLGWYYCTKPPCLDQYGSEMTFDFDYNEQSMLSAASHGNTLYPIFIYPDAAPWAKRQAYFAANQQVGLVS